MKMKYAAPIFIAMGAVCALWFHHASLGMEDSPVHTEELVFVAKDGKQHKFNVEIADTPARQEIGLMFRKSMDGGAGMLFEFGLPARPIAFWMKNTLIPLDIVFIDAAGRIVNIAANAVPQSLTPIPSGGPVTGVVEINGGEAKSLGIKAGDKVVHPFFR
jgi:uncharacterized membrane protein (UPF0127 family)